MTEDAKKQQMEYILVGVLVLVAVFIGVTRFKKSDAGDNEVFSRKEFNKKWKEVEKIKKETPFEEESVNYEIEPEKTPFKSPLEDREVVIVDDSNIVLPAMAFQGMIWNSRRPQAIIEKKIYDVNDYIVSGSGEIEERIKIIEITKKGIVLRYKGKDFIVSPKK